MTNKQHLRLTNYSRLMTIRSENNLSATNFRLTKISFSLVGDCLIQSLLFKSALLFLTPADQEVNKTGEISEHLPVAGSNIIQLRTKG